MSIASEVSRLQSAKADLKTAIEARGVLVGTDEKIDTYASKIGEITTMVKGQWSPETDTTIFSISDLSFVPEVVFVVISGSEEGLPPNSVVSYVKGRKCTGNLKFVNSSGNSGSLSVISGTSAETWTNNGYTLNIPYPDTHGYFRSGYTYHFFVAGGSN